MEEGHMFDHRLDMFGRKKKQRELFTDPEPRANRNIARSK